MSIYSLDGGHEASPDLYRICAVSDSVKASLGNSPGQNGGCGGAVTGLLVGVVGHILDQLGADVLELVLEFDCFGNCHAVFGYLWASPGGLDNYVPPLKIQFSKVCTV